MHIRTATTLSTASPASAPAIKPSYNHPLLRPQYYYQQTSRYLLRGGCAYRVSGVFLWNLASWDVIGLYPTCYDNGTCVPGAYRDPWVVELVREHNALVAGGRPPEAEAGAWALGPAAEVGAAPGLALAGELED